MTDTETDLEYCPDCDESVTYADDGTPECSCEWEEEVGVPTSMEDYLEELRAQGIDPRQWDHKNYHCLRRADSGWRNDKCAIYVRRDTLRQPLRIERLRWKAYENYNAHFARTKALSDEVEALPDQECFIPIDLEDLESWRQEREEKEDPLSKKELDRYGRPRRVNIRRDVSGERWCSYDDDFWIYQEPQHNGTAMEVIAAAAHLGEWENTIKPDRIKRSEDPAKLALGKRWKHEVQRGLALRDKCYLFNKWLADSICLSDVLPKVEHRHDKIVWVVLNGRRYGFLASLGYNRPSDNLWPVPSDEEDIVITGEIKLIK